MVNILICDDDQTRAADWVARIERLSMNAKVRALSPVEFARVVRDLKVRMASSRAQGAVERDDNATDLDAIDILILDSDLTPDPDAKIDDPELLVATHLVSEHGAEVAHLARTYTTVGSIAIVNQGAKSRTFDLTLSRFAKGVAEVYITNEDVDNRALWDPSAHADYRPWSWPALQSIGREIDLLIADLSLGDGVLQAIGLQEQGIEDLILLRQAEPLDLDDPNTIATLTFSDLAESYGFGLGSRPKERTSDSLRLRLSVFGLRRWLDRLVLPAQNILIDLPHLIERRPWLVADRENLDSWNDRSGWWWPALPSVLPDAYNAKASRLLGRNVWNISLLPEQEAFENVMPSDPVFCEDSSSFRPLSEAVDFLSDLEGGQSRRFVEKLADVSYSPPTRLMQ